MTENYNKRQVVIELKAIAEFKTVQINTLLVAYSLIMNCPDSLLELSEIEKEFLKTNVLWNSDIALEFNRRYKQ